MALTEFLGPCVIVTQDSVLSHFGFAVIDWMPVAQSLLRLAGLEATAANGPHPVSAAQWMSGTLTPNLQSTCSAAVSATSSLTLPGR
ncbi:hypothetical protein ACH47Z_41160 [Streptomyces sp. NPDC020192]|uniref:hypothetical protein n=1 Tax=Streptomyces sp. NPDC020192 TaxID=3365066 RepID=UPI00378C718D